MDASGFNLVAGIGVFALLIMGLAYCEKMRRRKLMAQRFAMRERLSGDAFYESYFTGQGISRDVVIGVREVLESILKADLSFLRDSDDFSRNLSFFWDFDSLADVEVVKALEDRFGIRIEDAEAHSTSTIRQLIELVHVKTTARGQAHPRRTTLPTSSTAAMRSPFQR